MMNEEKFILISMDDVRATKLSEVLGNKTCKKIIDYLANHEEASVKDVADYLEIPINTAEYNIKKLLEADLIQKRKNFFWSKKGKKIVMYELSNKSIVIAPKNSNIGSKLNSLIPAFMIIGVGTFASYVFSGLGKVKEQVIVEGRDILYNAGPLMSEAGAKMSASVPEDLIYSVPSPAWIWFLSGALLTLLIVSIVNWKKL
jgi:DNA-binding transcriptional ArsR family regulator